MTADSQELELARQQLRSQRRELHALTQRVAELEERLEHDRRAYDAAIAAEHRRADRYIEQLRLVRSSASWRVTRVVRRAVGGRSSALDADA